MKQNTNRTSSSEIVLIPQKLTTLRQYDFTISATKKSQRTQSP